MKRNRLNGTTNGITAYTLTEKREAVKKVKTLHNGGLSLNKSRAQVANEYGVTSSGVGYWERTVNKKKVRNITKTTKNTNITSTRGYSFNDLSSGVRGIAMSIINKDGLYSVKEAHAVSKLYSSELHRAKLEIEVHKMNEKSQTRDTLRIT